MAGAAQEGLAAIVPGVLDDAAKAAYAKAFDAKRDTTSGLGSMRELEECQLFDVVVGGAVIARYALKAIQRERGTEVYVVAAAGGARGVDLLQTVGPYIEQQAASANADFVTLSTKRRGLVKQMARLGWTLESYTMRKKIK